MNLIELVKNNRSYRRFDVNYEISKATLVNFIEYARIVSSARNQQSLKYKLVNTKDECDKVFPNLKWAGYLDNWDGPSELERPTAYIFVLNDTSIAKNHFCDEGIAMQTITLAATEKNLGCCIIASINKQVIREQFNIPSHLDILNIIAIGKPIENIVVDNMKNDDYKYWRDDSDTHHVPKRLLNDVIIP